MDIKVRDIVKSFDGGAAALSGVTLDVASGELMALLGPSGSGKTTLLRVIAGLEMPGSGSVHFGDVDASHLSVQERRVGFVFQHYALFRHMTVLDNIAYGLSVRPRRLRPTKAEINRRCRELLDLVQLGGLEARYPAQLSGGQRQRVALARALAVEPRVLLLDEPFGALDAKVRKELRAWLRDIHDRTGHTTLFVTHDQDEALELADRVAVLDKGRIEQVGTPSDVYDRPATRFVYKFIGESSTLPVEVLDGVLRLGAYNLGLEVKDLAPGPADLVVRPQSVKIIDQGVDALPAEVVRLRRSGGGRRAEVRLAETPNLLELDIPADVRVTRGDRLYLRVTGGSVFPKV